MATVTILADHKGVARPRVSGDEYVVDATINVNPYVAAGVVINASDLGLSTITAVTITGTEKAVGNSGFLPNIMLETDGTYTSASSFTIKATDLDGTNAAASDVDDVGMVRIRAYGLI